MATKVALVTGCSEPDSLGANIALDLKRRGLRVFATARQVETMSALQAEGCDVLSLDVINDESIRAAVAEVERAAGRLDVLVNNAGVASLVPLLDADLDRVRAMFDVNTFAPIRIIQTFAPLLVRTAKAGEGKGHATILNVGSTALVGPPFQGAYGASKAAIQTMTDSLRRELRNLNIKVVTVELAGVRTAMTNGEKPFDLLLPTPAQSGYFPNFPSIYTAARDVISSQLKTAVPAPTVARQIVDAAVAFNPPGKIWVGHMGWAFKWVFPFLPVSTVDNILYKALKADMVPKP